MLRIVVAVVAVALIMWAGMYWMSLWACDCDADNLRYLFVSIILVIVLNAVMYLIMKYMPETGD